MKSSTPVVYPDGLDILVCKILIWEPADKNTIDTDDPSEDKCLVIRECASIEIEESYKKLIGTALVKFPKGTIIKRTQTAEDLEKNGASIVYTERLNDGTITETRSGSSLAQPSDFKVGQRIRIYLGYYHDKGQVFANAEERRKVMEEEALNHTANFDGYIVKCSVSTPLEIKCENIASNLKRKTCPNVIINKATVVDLLKSDGKYKLLDGTGLEIHPDTLKEQTDIGKIKLSDDLTVADVLTEWSKYGLYCFICYEDNKPYIKVGMPYSKKKTMAIANSNEPANGTLIQFDYHVATDNLTLMNVDPAYLAVSAEGFKMEGDKQIKYSVTIRLNPQWTGTNDTEHKKFQLLNETKLSKKAMKMGAVSKSKSSDKVDLSQYHIIPYISRKIDISEDELVEEAEEYFENYNRNGVEGTLTIFGDLHIRSAAKVELLSLRNPEKNGWYRVEEVNTQFGVNGFRQTLKLPYCIAKPEQD